MPKYNFYADNNKFVLVTNKSPKGLSGILYIVWKGDIDNLTETAMSVSEIQKLQKVEDIPDDWYNAFASKVGLDPKIADITWPSIPLPKPVPITLPVLTNCVVIFLIAMFIILFIFER
jgi:hypothetical protein